MEVVLNWGEMQIYVGTLELFSIIIVSNTGNRDVSNQEL